MWTRKLFSNYLVMSASARFFLSHITSGAEISHSSLQSVQGCVSGVASVQSKIYCRIMYPETGFGLIQHGSHFLDGRKIRGRSRKADNHPREIIYIKSYISEMSTDGPVSVHTISNSSLLHVHGYGERVLD